MSLQNRVYARTHARDVAIKRMDCEKDEALDGNCLLERCSICLIDNKVKMLDNILTQMCSSDKEIDDLDKAVEIFESVCNDGKKEPIVLLSNSRWVACFNMLAFELLRFVLNHYYNTVCKHIIRY